MLSRLARGLSLAIASIVVAGIPAGAQDDFLSRFKFVPPTGIAERIRTSSIDGRRGSDDPDAISLKIVVPTVGGWTTTTTPTVYFFLDSAIDGPMTVSVTQGARGRALYTAKLEGPFRPGFHRIDNLREAPLQENQAYWVSVDAGRVNDRPVNSRGSIEVRPLNSFRIDGLPLKDALATARSAEERLVLYGRTSLWYESFATMMDIRARRESDRLQRLMLQTLKEADLNEAVQFVAGGRH